MKPIKFKFKANDPINIPFPVHSDVDYILMKKVGGLDNTIKEERDDIVNEEENHLKTIKESIEILKKHGFCVAENCKDVGNNEI